jgi:hypothetical protein
MPTSIFGIVAGWMENWLLLQTFYHGLNTSTRETIDAAIGGAFLSLNSQMQHHLLRRWLPIGAGMKNVLNLVREEDVCINSKRQTS